VSPLTEARRARQGGGERVKYPPHPLPRRSEVLIYRFPSPLWGEDEGEGARKNNASHIKRDTPPPFTSPLGGEDEGEGEGNTKSSLSHRKRWRKERGVKSAR